MSILSGYFQCRQNIELSDRFEIYYVDLGTNKKLFLKDNDYRTYKSFHFRPECLN